MQNTGRLPQVDGTGGGREIIGQGNDGRLKGRGRGDYVGKIEGVRVARILDHANNQDRRLCEVSGRAIVEIA